MQVLEWYSLSLAHLLIIMHMVAMDKVLMDTCAQLTLQYLWHNHIIYPLQIDLFASQHILPQQTLFNYHYSSGTWSKSQRERESWVRGFLSRIRSFHIFSSPSVPKVVFVYMGSEKLKKGQQAVVTHGEKIYILIKIIFLGHFCSYKPKFSVLLHMQKRHIGQSQLCTYTVLMQVVPWTAWQLLCLT